eukprot:5218954-Prymnesium_polylepis.1
MARVVTVVESAEEAVMMVATEHVDHDAKWTKPPHLGLVLQVAQQALRPPDRLEDIDPSPDPLRSVSVDAENASQLGAAGGVGGEGGGTGGFGGAGGVGGSDGGDGSAYT